MEKVNYSSPNMYRFPTQETEGKYHRIGDSSCELCQFDNGDDYTTETPTPTELEWLGEYMRNRDVYTYHKYGKQG